MFMHCYICYMYMYVYLTAKPEDPINFKSPVLNEATVCICIYIYIYIYIYKYMFVCVYMFMHCYICYMYMYVYLTAKPEDPINFKSPVLNEATVCTYLFIYM
jgi:uncharacterized membrane-anchored protein